MARTQKKTDNAFLQAKLQLRRYYLEKYHTQAGSVLDCCMGDGTIWRQLRSEYPHLRYWGVDLKPAKGRLQVDSLKILSQPGWGQDVIDIDTYGSPWGHIFGMAPHVARPVTVFATIGHVSTGGGGAVPGVVMDAMGLHFSRKLSNGFTGNILKIHVPYCLRHVSQYGIIVSDVMEADPGPHARYLGFRLEPNTETRYG